MSKKIKVNIPSFGERYCSNNVEYKLFYSKIFYAFYKKGTDIYHNEYGPAIEYENGGYGYYINGKYHRLSDYAHYIYAKINSYWVIEKYLGDTQENFIKNLANTLIPNK